MVVGVCTLVLHLPFSGSLKDKRKVLRSLKDRLRGRHNISMMEVDAQDLWQRAVLGIAAVGDGRPALEGLFARILAEVEGQIPGEVVDHEIHYL